MSSQMKHHFLLLWVESQYWILCFIYLRTLQGLATIVQLSRSWNLHLQLTLLTLSYFFSIKRLKCDFIPTHIQSVLFLWKFWLIYWLVIENGWFLNSLIVITLIFVHILHPQLYFELHSSPRSTHHQTCHQFLLNLVDKGFFYVLHICLYAFKSKD